jgi:hypothetical protein
MGQRDFHRGFVAAAARRQKDDRRQQIVSAQTFDQMRGRNFSL